MLTILQKSLLKQAFGWDKELQKEIVPLSNIFGNRFDDFVNSSNKEDVICCYKTKNAISLWLLGKKKNRVADHFEIEKRTSEKKRVAGDVKIEEEATKKNKVPNHLEMEEKIESANWDMFKVSFFY